jgi:hypothetical protein
MQEDSMYPNDGTYFGVPVEPEDQIIARKEEKAATLEAKKEIDKAIVRLSDRIDATSLIRTALNIADSYGCTRDEALIALDITRQQLEEEKLWFVELLEIHAKNLS